VRLVDIRLRIVGEKRCCGDSCDDKLVTMSWKEIFGARKWKEPRSDLHFAGLDYWASLNGCSSHVLHISQPCVKT
jgi:hypothetical protein